MRLNVVISGFSVVFLCFFFASKWSIVEFSFFCYDIDSLLDHFFWIYIFIYSLFVGVLICRATDLLLWRSSFGYEVRGMIISIFFKIHFDLHFVWIFFYIFVLVYELWHCSVLWLSVPFEKCLYNNFSNINSWWHFGFFQRALEM